MIGVAKQVITSVTNRPQPTPHDAPGAAAQTGIQLQQLQSLQTSVEQLKTQLQQKQALLKDCEECYEQLISSINALNTMIDDAYSVIRTQLLGDSKARVLKRCFDTAQAALNSTKLSSACEELDIEKGKIQKRITELENDIAWLQQEISRQEGEIRNIQNAQE